MFYFFLITLDTRIHKLETPPSKNRENYVISFHSKKFFTPDITKSVRNKQLCLYIRMSENTHPHTDKPAHDEGGIDATNKRIIALLQENGRRSYVSIGKEIGLSEAAVRLRVQKMIDDGVMQIVAVTNPMEMGFKRQAMVGITVNGDIEHVAQELKTITNVDYILITAGRFDILAEIFGEDDEKLLQVINRDIRRIDGINHTELFPYLRLESQRYDWGVR